MYIIGTDEAGRGPLAGSVFAGAAYIPQNFINNNLIKKVTDSKKLSEKTRFELYEQIKNSPIIYSVAKRGHEFIDRHNILYSALDAMKEAVENVISNLNTDKEKIKVLIDGNRKIHNLKYNNETIIKGDLLIKEISIASIIAKCEKDLEAFELHKLYPQYGFDSNKGYGTKKHIEALKKYGPSKVHRKTFAKIKDFFYSDKAKIYISKIDLNSQNKNILNSIKLEVNFSNIIDSEKKGILTILNKNLKKF